MDAPATPCNNRVSFKYADDWTQVSEGLINASRAPGSSRVWRKRNAFENWHGVSQRPTPGNFEAGSFNVDFPCPAGKLPRRRRPLARFGFALRAPLRVPKEHTLPQADSHFQFRSAHKDTCGARAKSRPRPLQAIPDLTLYYPKSEAVLLYMQINALRPGPLVHRALI
jgi:hypothetical protein